MTTLEPIQRMSKDIIIASKELGSREARFLVDAYYQMQEDRKRDRGQERAANEVDEPHIAISWMARQHETMEKQMARALGAYADAHPLGVWAQSNVGIGPILSAGLLSTIDIEKAPTAGHVWRFAGLDPTLVWKKGEKRPWNAFLKCLCFKMGDCFIKAQNHEDKEGFKDCFYGLVYAQRRELENERNEQGLFSGQAAAMLEAKRFRGETVARKAYESGKLPDAHLLARARRYAVKLFLSHYQLVGWWLLKRELPPAPYAIAHMDHTHMVFPPNLEQVEGLREALKARYGDV